MRMAPLFPLELPFSLLAAWSDRTACTAHQLTCSLAQALTHEQGAQRSANVEEGVTRAQGEDWQYSQRGAAAQSSQKKKHAAVGTVAESCSCRSELPVESSCLP